MQKMKYKLLLALPIALAVTSSYAASLASGGTDHLVGGGNTDDDYLISVNANNAGYANTYSGGTALTGSINVAFNGSIEGYNFVQAASNTIGSVFAGGGIVSTMTTTDTAFDSFQQGQGAIYTTMDPGADLLAPSAGPDSTALNSPGIRDLTDFSGTVDISGITEGSIYMFYGQWSGGASLTATMSGTALADINSGELFGSVTPVGQQNIFVTRIDFVNDLGYDSIAYTSTGSRLVGAVVTAVPEPSSLALLGFAGFALMLRRRR